MRNTQKLQIYIYIYTNIYIYIYIHLKASGSDGRAAFLSLCVAQCAGEAQLGKGAFVKDLVGVCRHFRKTAVSRQVVGRKEVDGSASDGHRCFVLMLFDLRESLACRCLFIWLSISLAGSLVCNFRDFWNGHQKRWMRARNSSLANASCLNSFGKGPQNLSFGLLPRVQVLSRSWRVVLLFVCNFCACFGQVPRNDGWGCYGCNHQALSC